MKKLIISGLILLVSTSMLVAQNAKVVTAFNYMQSLDYESAKGPIDEAINDPKTGAQAKTWFYRGAIYEQLYVDSNLRKKHLEALPEAIRSYKMAMKIDPKNQWKDQIKQGLLDCANLSYNEGVAPYNRKDFQSAYNNFRAAVDVYAYMNDSLSAKLVDTFASMYAASAAIKLKHYDDAEQLYKNLQQGGISQPEMYSSLSEIYLAKGDTAKAEDIIGKGRQVFPNDKQLMIDELNIVLFTKDCNKAIEKLQEAIKLSPDLTVLYVRLGDSYDRCNDTANSHAAYQQAIDKAPGNLVGYYQLGISYYNIAANLNNEMLKLPDSQQKQIDALRVKRDALFKKSLGYLEHAHQIDPKDMDTLIALKQVYARLNMLDKLDEVKKEIEALGG